MSSQGTGAVVFLPGAVLLVVGGVVVGTGIVIGKGIMWCHDKMEENYREACKSYSNLRERAQAELLSRPVDRTEIIAATIEMNTAASNLMIDGMSDLGQAQPAQQAHPELLNLLRQVQETITAGKVQPSDYGREKERRRLAIAIAAAGNLQDVDALAAAKRALGGSVQDMLEARKRLDTAWQQVADERAQRTRYDQYVGNAARVTRYKVEAVRALAEQQAIPLGTPVKEKIESAEQFLLKAQAILPNNGAEAARVADDALRHADDAVYAMATMVESRQDVLNEQLALARGQLRALHDVISDVKVGKLAPDADITKMTQRATSLEERCAALASVTDASDAKSGIAQLYEAIDSLKAEAFTFASTRLRRQIGDLIAETLGELGFEPIEDGARLAATSNGDSLTITARRREPSASGGSDDHLVYFHIDKRGRVGYHFDGYEGEACTREADRVFKALRKRGVLISTATKVSALDRNIEESALRLEELAPALDVNTQQALRQQALLGVLRRLGHTHIEQRIIGGVFEIDAHNGLGHVLHTQIDADGDVTTQESGTAAPEATPEVIKAVLQDVVATSPDDEAEPEPGEPQKKVYMQYDSSRTTLQS